MLLEEVQHWQKGASTVPYHTTSSGLETRRYEFIGICEEQQMERNLKLLEKGITKIIVK